MWKPCGARDLHRIKAVSCALTASPGNVRAVVVSEAIAVGTASTSKPCSKHTGARKKHENLVCRFSRSTVGKTVASLLRWAFRADEIISYRCGELHMQIRILAKPAHASYVCAGAWRVIARTSPSPAERSAPSNMVLRLVVDPASTKASPVGAATAPSCTYTITHKVSAVATDRTPRVPVIMLNTLLVPSICYRRPTMVLLALTVFRRNPICL